MIELAFVAGVELQLVLGIVDVAHAEDVLVEKLLRTLAEIFELGGGDGGDGVGEFGAQRRVVVLGEEVAVEDGLRAHFREQLQLAASWERGRLARCGSCRALRARRPRSQESRCRRMNAPPKFLSSSVFRSGCCAMTKLFSSGEGRSVLPNPSPPAKEKWTVSAPSSRS